MWNMHQFCTEIPEQIFLKFASNLLTSGHVLYSTQPPLWFLPSSPLLTPVAFRLWQFHRYLRRKYSYPSSLCLQKPPQLREHLRPPGHNTGDARSSPLKNEVWHIKVFAARRMLTALPFLSFIYGEWFSIIKWAAVGGERGGRPWKSEICLKNFRTAGREKGASGWVCIALKWYFCGVTKTQRRNVTWPVHTSVSAAVK